MEQRERERLLAEVERLEAAAAAIRRIVDQDGEQPAGYDLLSLLSAFEAAVPDGLDYHGRLEAYERAGIDARGAGGLFQRTNTPGYLRWKSEPVGPAVLTDEGRRELARLRRRAEGTH